MILLHDRHTHTHRKKAKVAEVGGEPVPSRGRMQMSFCLCKMCRCDGAVRYSSLYNSSCTDHAVGHRGLWRVDRVRMEAFAAA